MCQFKSALVLKDKIFLPDYDSHDKMLQELEIEDNFTNASKVFVRVELSPTDGNIFSDVDGWKLKVDQDILPEWWNEAERLPQLKELVETWMRKHTIYAGEHEVADGIWFATGSATVKAIGSATVRVYGNATVNAYNSATVNARDSATVNAYDSATVNARDSAAVTVYNSATVRATDNAIIRAYGSATVTAIDSVIVNACDSATVKAIDSTTVRAYGSATVRAYGSATVIIPERFATDGVIELNDDSVCINHKIHIIRRATKWKWEE